MRPIRLIGLILILGIAALAFFSWKRGSEVNLVATVNKEGIKKDAFETKVEEAKTYFNWAKQDPSALSSLEKDTMENLIEETLIRNFAKENKITVMEGEISDRFQTVLEGFNRRENATGEEKFLAKIKEMYGLDKSGYMKQVEMDILKEKVQSKVGMPLASWLAKQKESSDIKILKKED